MRRIWLDAIRSCVPVTPKHARTRMCARMRSRVRMRACVRMRAGAPQWLRARQPSLRCRCRYTDEFTDAHTRAVLLRGGSNYRPAGSVWYFPQAVELGTHNKYFLMSDSYERAGTIGFRCVTDAQT
jgi:hypothetical protein